MRKITIKIPAGVESGSRLKIAGEGEHAPNGGITGDLYVLIHVKKHKFFERNGNDLLCAVDISFPLACVGGDIEVNTIYNQILKMKIPAGTENNQIFRLRGSGMPYLGSHGKGDLLVKINIVTPKKISARQRELLKEFAELSGEPLEGELRPFY